MPNPNNPYRPIEAEVLDVFDETPTIKTIQFRTREALSFETGQFVEITIPGVGEAPFTPSSRPSLKNSMEVTVMKVGRVTEKIHELKQGDVIGVRGPLGTGYPIETFKGKEVLVVGGGCGFAPIRSLMYELFEKSSEFKRLYFRGGCRNPREFVYLDEIRSWGERKDLNSKITVDEGDETWKESVGMVTTILHDVEMDFNEGIVVVCGPPIMMKFVTQELLGMGFPENHIYLSMEKNMSCGIGKCGHCRLGIYYACKDGPVFTYDKIKDLADIWD